MSRDQAYKTAEEVRQVATRWENVAQQRQAETLRHAYVDTINGAYSAWRNARVASALELLERCRPQPGEDDPRGFEWYYVRRLCEGGRWNAQGHETRPIYGSSFSADGARLATGGEDGTIQIWDASTGQLLSTINSRSDSVYDVVFSPEGQFLASVGGDGCLRIWAADTYELRRTVRAQPYRLSCLAISKDGRSVAVAGDGDEITVWDPTSGELQISVSANCEQVFGLDFSADGRLAAACSDKTAKVGNLAAVDEPILLTENATEILCVAFAPNGSQLATGGSFVSVWDLDRGSKVTLRPGHENFVRSVVFSADGKMLASAGNDEVIRVWDAVTGAEQRRYRGHRRPILDLAFSPNDDSLASSDKGGMIKYWEAGVSQGSRPFHPTGLCWRRRAREQLSE